MNEREQEENAWEMAVQRLASLALIQGWAAFDAMVDEARQRARLGTAAKPTLRAVS